MPKVQPKTAKTIGALVGGIGLVASVLGIYDHFVLNPKPDRDYKLITENTRLRFSRESAKVPPAGLVEVGQIDIDGTTVDVPSGTVFVANKVLGSNGGRLRGSRFGLVAPSIEGVALDVSGKPGENAVRTGDALTSPTQGSLGGTLVVATGEFLHSTISATGGAGGNGLDGRDQPQAKAGTNGSDGDCGGFGNYKGAKSGATARTALMPRTDRTARRVVLAEL